MLVWGMKVCVVHVDGTHGSGTVTSAAAINL